MIKNIILLIILLPVICFAETVEKIPELTAVAQYRFSREKMTKENLAEWLLAYMIAPSGIAVKGDYLYVSDTYNHRIQALKIASDASLSFGFTFGKKGKEKGEFSNPQGLLVKGDYLYVSDSANRRIQVLKINSDGMLTAEFTFGREGKGNGEFLWPQKLAVKDDYLYVSDGQSRPEENHRIQALKINSDGSLSPEFVFGKEGKGKGEFNTPCGLATKGDYLYVSDAENNRMQALKINNNGRLSFAFTFGKKGGGKGEFFTPKGLAVKGNNLYVCDKINSYIQILSIAEDGRLSFLSEIGGPRGGGRLGNLDGPEDIAIKDDYIFVVDYYNNRVQVFKIKE
ncbi:MAG: NHL repeat-containing protein [Candidatus Omnitrophota bacterium]